MKMIYVKKKHYNTLRLDRFLAALEFEPNFQITYIDRVDEMDEEDFKEDE